MDNEDKPFVTAAEAHGIEDRTTDHTDGTFHQGLSFTPGLTEVANSKVPGAEHSHVHGPQQAAVDPVAAGLVTTRSPATAAESRVIDRTGEIGSGPRAGGKAVSDGSQAPAAPDKQAPVTPADPI